jgi:undecaprenyl-diphosphatase
VITFDLNILAFFNQFSHRIWAIDKAVFFMSGCQLLKGGVLVAIIWWGWFKSNERQSQAREHIIVTLLSCFIAMFLARILALALPFRPRPLHDETLVFLRPHGMGETEVEGWSSFPSDHAVLFFALCTGISFVSKKAGVFAFAYTALFIALPKIYLGLHYPSDIIVGAIVGVTIALIGNVCLIRSKPIKSITLFSSSRPDIFYPVFFLLTYQIADMFEDTRHLIRAGLTLFQSSLG